MATLADVTMADWTISLNASGEIVEGIAEINQSIGVIIMTERGSVPGRPEFGSDVIRSLDKPITQAKASVVASVVSALETWEKRIVLSKIKVNLGNDLSLKMSIFWTPVEGTTLYESVLNLNTK